MEQTSSSAYPNILVVDYVKKARVASPKLLHKAEHYLNVGYQKLLTFQHQTGGFNWWGNDEPPVVWLSAYALQEFSDMARVYPVDPAVIERTQAWLMKQRGKDGTWDKIEGTHGAIERMGNPRLLLTSYVTWSLLDSGVKREDLKPSIAYIRAQVKKADNAYILALAANALAAYNATDEALIKVLKKLNDHRQVKAEWQAVYFPAEGQSLAHARDDSLTVETTALAVLAMVRTGQCTESVNKGLTYLIKSRGASGTWGSTQATILALKALVAAAGSPRVKGEVPFDVLVNGASVADGKITEDNADVLQLFDLSVHLKPGANTVSLKVAGKTGLMYQVVGRHYVPFTDKEESKKSILDVQVAYDRTRLTTRDVLKARATVKYSGKEPTYMVIVDLGIAPGFLVDPGEFAAMVGAGRIKKFSVTARQVTLYLGEVKPGETLTFEYTLKPKYPIKARAPGAVAYEYYTPANRAASKPVELLVEE